MTPDHAVDTSDKRHNTLTEVLSRPILRQRVSRRILWPHIQS